MKLDRRLTLLAAALACAVMGAGEARGLVLCIGDAGHMAIEAAHDGDAACHCGDCPPCGTTAVAGFRCGQCGGCLDIPLSPRAGDRTAPNGRVVRDGAAPSLRNSDAHGAQTPVAGISGPGRAGVRDPALHRTPILRI